MNQTDPIVPPAAEGLPAGTLEAAEIGANRLDAWARTPHGRNFLAHALVQLARTGWLRTEPGEGFEPMSDRETPDPLPAASAVVSPPTDRAAVLLWAADELEAPYEPESGYDRGRAWCVEELRRLAVEHGTGTQQQPEAPVDRAAVERAFAERLAAELKGCCQECDACIEIAQHMAGSEEPAPVAQQPAAVPQRAYPDCERCGNTSIDPERDGAEPCPECQQAAAADDEETPRCGCPNEDALEHQFGTEHCTCIPFTRQTNPPRYLNQPGDTVDKVSGWEPGADCPYHARRP